MCGIRRSEDAVAAARLGADAVGLIFFPGSARAVTLAEACVIKSILPPFVATVALFVNAEASSVNTVISTLKPSLLQFHGDEEDDFCAQFSVPFLKAIRVGDKMRPDDLIQCATQFPSAVTLLLDTLTTGSYGGTGETFDWSVIPVAIRNKIILSGGLSADNVDRAVQLIRPWAVDVSSGIEASKGVKDHIKMARFVEAVRAADATRSSAINQD